MWAKQPNIYTPNKLRPTAFLSCLDYKQIAIPTVHATRGETISSYKQLMHDPATAETWQRAFRKDFGGTAQCDNKTGQKGTKSIFIMTNDKIEKIPKNQMVTYAQVVVDFWPQKVDPHCICITAVENLINYPGKFLTCTTGLTTSKLMWNSVLSTEGAKYVCLDMKISISQLPLIVLNI
jgi:hypothetical protein